MRPHLQDLIAEYRESLRLARRAWRLAESPGDREVIGGMIRDLQWTITYMETGYPPPERWGPYPRVVPVDPALLDRVRAVYCEFTDRGLGERAAMRSALWNELNRLSPMEREVFVLVVGEAFSEREVARMLKLSRRTVRTLLQRARQKLVVDSLAM
ncbi:sigma factor-like helix-turn-helix DNA-binding protein [Thermaerobacter composti]|uniref:Sigma factor-like helix-turn-helix DNA-binding protein n=1 Tax=Thermaerobacter composti TaxID=554949 RepID=A0ABZ0QUG8_9FIRM|nr:sigma factor-like helix-turn-helix DNA-binding protein [Thermaerobacter composti]WPD20193.1 sigma factor-like helix-turn-helix DNA-binding protein [Thermaerobacter composti]